MTRSKKFSYAFILGSHPALSFFELVSVLRERGITPGKLARHFQVALCETATPLPAEELMVQLGGTVKIVELLAKTAGEDAVLDLLLQHYRDDRRLILDFHATALNATFVQRAMWQHCKKWAKSSNKV